MPSNPSPTDLQAWIIASANNNGIDPQIYAALIEEESSNRQYDNSGGLLTSQPQYQLPNGSYTNDPNASGAVFVANGGAVGLAQVTSASANQYASGLDPTNPQQNVEIGARILRAKLQSKFGDPPYTPEQMQQGIHDYVGNGSAADSAVIRVNAISKGALGDTSSLGPGSNGNYQNDISHGEATIAMPLTEYNVAEATVPDLIVKTGLDEVPWYSNKNLVVPRTRKDVVPVSFEVVLRDQDGGQYIVDKYVDGVAATGSKPIQIQLNASMKTFNLSSKHNFHPQRTRTGWHITMWGMNADTIEGSCSTGVFMNQFGLTDLFSVSRINDILKKLVTSGLIFTDVTSADFLPKDPKAAASALNKMPMADLAGTGTPTNVTISPTESNYTDLLRKILGYRDNVGYPVDPNSVLRVAAQDAFVELLSLFKMNGNVWFWSQNYNNSYSDIAKLQTVQRVGISTYSPKTGLSDQQMNARNNDVLTRGYVIMKFRTNSYLGYFKNINWTMDANNPFQWNFNFVFQVERTISQLYVPR